MMLDTLEAHRMAFPEPPVSRPRIIPPVEVAPVVERKAPALNPQQLLTRARVAALRGRGPLDPADVGAIWARAGVHAEDPAAILRYYHTTGVMVRIRDGKTGPGHPPPLYVVAAEIHNDPPASGKPYPRGSAIHGAHPGGWRAAGKPSRPVGGGLK